MTAPQTETSTSITAYLDLTADPRSIRIIDRSDGRHRVSIGFFDGASDVDLVLTVGSLAALRFAIATHLDGETP